MHNLSSPCVFCTRRQAKKAVQAAEIGIASSSAGSIFTTANILIPQIRRPVANSNRPPTAVKSAIIAGVVSGRIIKAQKASVSWMTSIGTLMAQTAKPSEQAKIMAVKKSRNDLAMSMVGSPVIPSCIEPKIPVPLAQNSTMIAT